MKLKFETEDWMSSSKKVSKSRGNFIFTNKIMATMIL